MNSKHRPCTPFFERRPMNSPSSNLHKDDTTRRKRGLVRALMRRVVMHFRRHDGQHPVTALMSAKSGFASSKALQRFRFTTMMRNMVCIQVAKADGIQAIIKVLQNYQEDAKVQQSDGMSSRIYRSIAATKTLVRLAALLVSSMECKPIQATPRSNEMDATFSGCLLVSTRGIVWMLKKQVGLLLSFSLCKPMLTTQ